MHAGLVIGVIALIPFLFPSFHFFTTENNNDFITLKFEIINNRLDVLERKMDNMDNKLTIIQNDITELHSKFAGGDLKVNGSENGTYNISITAPSNKSILHQRFMVNGTTNLDYELCEKGIYKIFIISRLGNQYWIQTEAYPDENGNWRGYRPCIFPNKYNNITIYSMITKNDYLLAESFEEIPEYISISNPIYISR